jgi:hypothetical protein
MQPLTPMQLRILAFLASNPGWHSREPMRESGCVGEFNYAREIGAHDDPAPHPDTLLGRGYVEWRPGDGGTIEYRFIRCP